MAKISIRTGVFETNSSSAHTFILTKNLPKKGFKENIEDFKEECRSDGYFKVEPNQSFDSNFSIFNDYNTKIAYVLASSFYEDFSSATNEQETLGFGSLFIFEELTKAIQKYYPDFKGFEFGKLNKDYINDTVINKIESEMYYNTGLWGFFGSVDHQSIDKAQGFITAWMKKFPNSDFGDALCEIIFDPNVLISTDSDGSDGLEYLLKAGYIDGEKIRYILSENYDNGKSHWRLLSLKDYEERYNKDYD